MNVTRCKNGHFFDRDSYEKCPHCGEDEMTANSAVSRKEEKKFFWNRGKKEIAKPAVPAAIPASNGTFGKGDEKTDVGELREITDCPPPSLKKNTTLDFWQTVPDREASVETERSVAPQVAESTAPVSVMEPNISREEQVEQCENNEPKPAPASSLKEAVKNASASNAGKTMSYFSTVTASAGSAQKQSADPVVGWLVCVGGCHFGECFSLYAGKNSIGRSEENRIVISDDNGISRLKHALIVYEPKKRNFYLQPGDSSGLTYLNDDYITESRMLSSFDAIELGESKFLFVPLCGESFSWEEYVRRGE